MATRLDYFSARNFMAEPQAIGTCVILINSKNEVLLGKRKNSYKAGLFGLPGGRVEINEPILAATAREVEEETGVKGIQFEFVGVIRENQGSYDFIHFAFAGKITTQQPELCEPEKCEGWEWFELSAELDQVLPGHAAAIQLYLNQNTLADLTK